MAVEQGRSYSINEALLVGNIGYIETTARFLTRKPDIRHETDREIRRAVQANPVMELRYDGFSGPEIAAMTGMTLPAVKSRIHRWREEYRSLIG